MNFREGNMKTIFIVPLQIYVFIEILFDYGDRSYLDKFRSPLIKLPFANIREENYPRARTITLDQEIPHPNDARQRCQSQELNDQGSFTISKKVEKFGKKYSALNQHFED